MNKIEKMMIDATKYAIKKHPIADGTDELIKSFKIGSRIHASQEKLAMMVVEECIKWIDDNVGSISPEARVDLMKYLGIK